MNKLATILALAFATLSAKADITLPHVLAEHMVLQRNKPIHLWGNADPGEPVRAQFRAHTADTRADNIGRWSLTLPAESASGGPYDLTLAGHNTVIFHDILIGDVWLASGQSNMEMPVGIHPPWKLGIDDHDKILAEAHYPNIRLFQVEMNRSDYPQPDTAAATWVAATTPAAVNSFSAIGYLFAREIAAAEHIPIGILEADVGGTPIEAWMSMDSLVADPAFVPVFQEWALVSDKELTVAATLAARKRKSADDRAKGLDAQIVAERARETIFVAPAQLFNAMISPLLGFPIRGALWFQGEGNAQGPTLPIYRQLHKAMILDWRKRWASGDDFPFFLIQLSNRIGNTHTPEIREAQRRLLADLPNLGMEVSIDVGDPNAYHPTNKVPVAHRLALLARSRVYGETIEDSGPLFRSATPEGAAIRISFDHTGTGLALHGPTLSGFEVAGADRHFVPATAALDANAVVVTSAQVAVPRFVRYAWTQNPTASLFNREGLPASPFTSEP